MTLKEPLEKYRAEKIYSATVKGLDFLLVI